MSIQSDVELLSVRAIEEYAKRNHLSTLSAIESKSHNRRDFGMGFYTTILES